VAIENEARRVNTTGSVTKAAMTSVPTLLRFLIIFSLGILPYSSEPIIDHEVTLWKQGKSQA